MAHVRRRYDALGEPVLAAGALVHMQMLDIGLVGLLADVCHAAACPCMQVLLGANQRLQAALLDSVQHAGAAPNETGVSRPAAKKGNAQRQSWAPGAQHAGHEGPGVPAQHDSLAAPCRQAPAHASHRVADVQPVRGMAGQRERVVHKCQPAARPSPGR